MMEGRKRLSSMLWHRVVWTFFLVGCAPTLAGTVKSTEGEMVVSSDARVNLTSLIVVGEKHMASIKVDERGKFSTRDPLPEGDYLIEALVPGYSVTSKKIRIGQKGDITLLLQPVNQQKSTAIGVNLQGDQARGAGGATLTPPTF
jgi:hypothetical protein